MTVPTASTPGGKRRRDEHSERGVELDAGACLGEQGVRGLASSRGDDEIARDLLPVDDQRSHAAAPTLSFELAHGRLAQVDDTLHCDSRLAQVVGDLEPWLVGCEHHRALPRLDRKVVDQPANRARQHHADQIVAREHDRLLERARRDDDPLRPVPVEHGSAVHGDETALPDPERACGRQHFDSGQLRELSRPLVDEHHARAFGRRRERSRAAGFRSADDQDARAPVLHVVAPRVPAPLVDAAEPGEVPQNLLVQRPRTARPDHRPVVEADRA